MTLLAHRTASLVLTSAEAESGIGGRIRYEMLLFTALPRTSQQDCGAHVDGSDKTRLSAPHVERRVSASGCGRGGRLSDPSNGGKARRRPRGFVLRLAPVAVAPFAFGIAFADHGVGSA
jgi:hypothetical protein